MTTRRKPTLEIIDSELPKPPYPQETKANGFNFEIDLAHLLSSDTWAITDPELRPWCLMGWVISWNQIPCGSLPKADEVIAARLGCPLKFFLLHRDEIMRGWVRHNDNRFYHPFITKKVLEMLKIRKKWRVRKNNSRRGVKSYPQDENNEKASKNKLLKNKPVDNSGASVDNSEPTNRVGLKNISEIINKNSAFKEINDLDEMSRGSHRGVTPLTSYLLQKENKQRKSDDEIYRFGVDENNEEKNSEPTKKIKNNESERSKKNNAEPDQLATRSKIKEPGC